jgi:NADPH2:quinone reductase
MQAAREARRRGGDMRAVQCVAYGEAKDLVVTDLPDPVAGPGQVVIAVEATGLGFVDGLHVRGGYQIRHPLPFIPGTEIAGRVIALGQGAPPALMGARVLAFSETGGLAEKIAVPAEACAILPDSVSAPSAASALINYCTALYGLEDCGHVRAGESVLVLGAGGGVGMAVIDVAKSLGAFVIAAASSHARRDAALARGADLAVDYTQPDWRRTLERDLAGRPVNIVWDSVGAGWSETAFRCLAPGGRHLVVGFAGGDIARLPLNLALLKRASLVGVDWGGHIRADRAAGAELLIRLVTRMTRGVLSPRPDSTYALAEAPAALDALMTRASVGKAVVLPQS